MKNHLKILSMLGILLITTLACSLTGGADPLGSLQTLVPAEAQTQVVAMLTPAATDAVVVPTSVSSSNGDCDNPLYPVVAGATWSYAMTGPLPDTFTRSISALTSNGFTDQDVFGSGTTRTGQWTCDAGTLVALDPGGGSGFTANVQAVGLDSNFQTTYTDGVTFPAEIEPGTSWTQNFTIEGVQNLNGQEVLSKNETAYNCTAGDYETVTVPAGTFEAIRVDCQVNIIITITMAGMDIPTNVNSTTTAWHAQGVGMVKSVSNQDTDLSTSIELTAYNIP
jgi:hypothetical protein